MAGNGCGGKQFGALALHSCAPTLKVLGNPSAFSTGTSKFVKPYS